jgi:predicted RNA-binding protein with PIN domain
VTVPLPEPVRLRVVELAAAALGELEPDQLPAALRRIASFAPARRARLAGPQIGLVLERDEDFRGRVAERVRTQLPDLAKAVEGGDAPPDSTPADLAAAAYLLRPEGWSGQVDSWGRLADLARAAATERGESERVSRLERQLEASQGQVKELRSRHREQLGSLKAENADLRHRLGEARSRQRAAEDAARDAAAVSAETAETAAAQLGDAEAELRRLRSRVDQLEADLAAVRRAERIERGAETLRARLLLDTLLETAQGLRRELALPAVEGSPADAVAALVAEHGSRRSSAHGSMAADDPALLDQLLTLPRAHLVVDGYNVTKTAWPELSLERQRDRLLAGLAPLAARSGAEVTVVFDAAATTERPLVNRPRGVRVLYSQPGVIADDVIRDLVAAEPRGRPLVVVSSDRAVVDDVVRAGARAVAAAALARLLART